MYAQLLQNAALLALLCVLHGLLTRMRQDKERRIKVLSGVLFGAVAVAGMSMPVQYRPGIFYDGRSIVLSLAGLFGGGTASTAAVALAGAYRAYLGGAGVWAGVATILACPLVGLAFRRAYGNRPEQVPLPWLYGMGLAAHAATLACQLLLPWPESLHVLRKVAAPMLVVFPAATFAIGLVLSNEERRLQAERGLRASEQFLRDVFSSIRDGISVLDADMTIRLVNPTMEQWYAASMPLVGKKCYEAYHGRDSICDGCPTVSALQTGEAHGQAHRAGVESPVEWVDLFSYPMRDESGRVAGVVEFVRDITERKRAEEALRQSEQRFRRVYEESPIAYQSLDPDGRLLDVNPAWLDLLGYARDDVIGRRIDEFMVPASRAAFAQGLERFLETGSIHGAELDVVRKDGETLTISFDGVFVRDAEGRPIHTHCVLHNVTERKRAERALQLTRYSVDHARVAMYWMGPDGRFSDVNDAACRMLGYTREELLNMAVPDIDPEFPAERWPEHWKELRERGSMLIESTHRTKDGREFPVEISANFMEFEGQEFNCALATDITLRKQAEAERERLSTALEQAAEVVLITDPAGTIQYVNPAFEQVTGYSREEALGQNPRILKSGEHDDAFYRELWETISNGRTWRRRFTNKRKDGTLYTEAACISPVFDPAGRIVNYVAVKRDITEHLAVTARLQQAQKMESIGRLAGGIAHDFNNILTGISGLTEFALASTPSDSPYRDDLVEVLNLAKRAANLTHQLLAFSRRQTLQPVVLDLNQVVEGMSKMLVQLIGEDIEFVCALAPNLGMVKADSSQIDQVLMNLALNARDAMPDGGALTIETANVALDAEYAATHQEVEPGPYVMLAISDTGSGMDAEVCGHLFEPFYTTKGLGKGTGLGLATVYGIVKQHGGSISVYSEPGKGSTFKVYLPRVDEDAPSSAPTPAHAAPTGSETILVVEDEQAVCDIAQRSLQAFGYRIYTAATPAQAEAVLNEHGADIALLLTDVVLPGRNGRQVYEAALERSPHLLVLYMSGYTENAIAHRGVLEPGTPFLQKPFTPDQLARKVRQVLDGARTQ